jgi:DNA processing protein
VVEAGSRSGALITAEHALEMGRDVFAVPGPIDSEPSQGTNRLIFDGAQPVLDEAGLLHLLGAHEAARGGSVAPGVAVVAGADGVIGGTSSAGAPRNDEQVARAPLLAALGRRALTLDELAAAARLDVARARAQLTALELECLVRRIEGGRYARRLPGG